MKTFKNKVAIVTGGGGRGIGNALVNELARQGATVVVVSRVRVSLASNPS